jgi:hypothetical protein
MLANRLLMAGDRGMPLAGLLLWYDMINYSGSTLINNAGGNNAQIYNGSVGAGFVDFNGSNTRIDVAGFEVKRQKCTYFVDITPDVIGDNDSIVDDIGGWGACFFRFLSGRIYFYIWNGSSYRTLTAAVSSANRYKIVAQHDSDIGSQLWVNGVLVQNNTTPMAIVYRGLETGRRLGATYELASGRFYDGKLWEYAEYNRFLTAQEIARRFS